jgi:hypothetical protein
MATEKQIKYWNSLKGKHTNPKTEYKKGDNIGENHACWKGDKIGKRPIHKWVKYWKGSPNHCEMCGRIEKRMYHWANVDHSYKRILDDYISMCVPCHKKYDKEKNTI